MNKIFAVLLFISSFIMVGCDRATLDGLNLKINAEVQSDYDDETNEKKNNNENKNENKETKSSESSSENNAKAEVEKPESTVVTQKEETSKTPSAQENNTAENDPDAPMPFKEIPECSKSGITAKTNEIFYADNPQVKSIDSKNQKQVKEWQRIYAQVEKECQ